MALQGYSASSLPSLYEGESWKRGSVERVGSKIMICGLWMDKRTDRMGQDMGRRIKLVAWLVLLQHLW